MSIANVYANQVKEHFKVLFANWEPGSPIRLGDYGILQKNIFIPQGNLEYDFNEFKDGVIKISEDPSKDEKEFKSETGVEVNLLAKGALNPNGTPLAKALLDIRFSQPNTVFFSAAGCTTYRIQNKKRIGDILKELMKKGKWEKQFCVVTDLVQADRTIIAISESSNSAFQIEAESPALEAIKLGDASIKLAPKAEKSIGYKLVAEEGLNLLCGLCKIKNPFLWWGGDFRPRTSRMTRDMTYAIENAPGIRTEESVDELIFGQLGKD